jgi:hypothetical protein
MRQYTVCPHAWLNIRVFSKESFFIHMLSPNPLQIILPYNYVQLCENILSYLTVEKTCHGCLFISEQNWIEGRTVWAKTLDLVHLILRRGTHGFCKWELWSSQSKLYPLLSHTQFHSHLSIRPLLMPSVDVHTKRGDGGISLCLSVSWDGTFNI